MVTINQLGQFLEDMKPSPLTYLKENLNGFFLEYDDERSGDFEPLRFFNDNAYAVLGLITSKTGELENKDTIKKN